MSINYSSKIDLLRMRVSGGWVPVQIQLIMILKGFAETIS